MNLCLSNLVQQYILLNSDASLNDPDLHSKSHRHEVAGAFVVINFVVNMDPLSICSSCFYIQTCMVLSSFSCRFVSFEIVKL